jgi:hypothetical protein
MTDLNRRTFLIGAAGITGAAGLVAACGDDGGVVTQPAEDSTTTTTDAPVTDTAQQTFTVPLLVPTFPDGIFVHSVEQRVAYVLHDGVDIMRANAPDSVQLDVFHGDERIAGGEMPRRVTVVATPYYSIRFTPPTADRYRSVLTVDGETTEHEFLVVEPGTTSVPQPGDVLPAINTGTFDDARGVDPLCTRAEPCPFHATNLVDALGVGDKPTVLSIATPGFCQTAICGPVIDLLIDVAADRDDLHVVHAEVYVDPHNDEGVFTGSAATTEIVDAFLLPYEPVLFVTDATGTIVRRLDAIYDGSELAEALALV